MSGAMKCLREYAQVRLSHEQDRGRERGNGHEMFGHRQLVADREPDALTTALQERKLVAFDEEGALVFVEVTLRVGV